MVTEVLIFWLVVFLAFSSVLFLVGYFLGYQKGYNLGEGSGWDARGRRDEAPLLGDKNE